MPRTFQDGSSRKVEATEPPWVPVAPMTAISLTVDMLVVVDGLDGGKDEGWEREYDCCLTY
jgi:hypothetical protein